MFKILMLKMLNSELNCHQIRHIQQQQKLLCRCQIDFETKLYFAAKS